MRILFDHGTPAPLIPLLEGHAITKAKDIGWERLVNSEPLKAAEQAEFDVLLTTDKNMASQQNLKSRTIAIVVLGNSQWRIVQRYVRRIATTNSRSPLGQREGFLAPPSFPQDGYAPPPRPPRPQALTASTRLE